MKASYKTTQILALINAVLLLTFIVQLSLEAQRSPKILKLRQIDSLVIEKLDSIVELTKHGESWTINLKNKNNEVLVPEVEAIAHFAESLADLVREIKVLSVVSSGSQDARFGFDETSVLHVRAYAKGKIVRSIEVGNNSPLGNQSYVKLDGSKEVSLVGSDYRSRFSIGYDELVQTEDAESLESGAELNF